MWYCCKLNVRNTLAAKIYKHATDGGAQVRERPVIVSCTCIGTCIVTNSIQTIWSQPAVEEFLVMFASWSTSCILIPGGVSDIRPKASLLCTDRVNISRSSHSQGHMTTDYVAEFGVAWAKAVSLSALSCSKSVVRCNPTPWRFVAAERLNHSSNWDVRPDAPSVAWFLQWCWHKSASYIIFLITRFAVATRLSVVSCLRTQVLSKISTVILTFFALCFECIPVQAKFGQNHTFIQSSQLGTGRARRRPWRRG